MKSAVLRTVEVQPHDWLSRSALTLFPGAWRMRNGHTARIEKLLRLPYGEGKFFPVWKGFCVECNEPKTWNLNGTYAAVGKHDLDIVGPE